MLSAVASRHNVLRCEWIGIVPMIALSFLNLRLCLLKHFLGDVVGGNLPEGHVSRILIVLNIKRDQSFLRPVFGLSYDLLNCPNTVHNSLRRVCQSIHASHPVHIPTHSTTVLPSSQLQKFLPGFRTTPQTPQHTTRNSLTPTLLHPPHNHA